VRIPRFLYRVYARRLWKSLVRTQVRPQHVAMIIDGNRRCSGAIVPTLAR